MDVLPIKWKPQNEYYKEFVDKYINADSNYTTIQLLDISNIVDKYEKINYVISYCITSISKMNDDRLFYIDLVVDEDMYLMHILCGGEKIEKDKQFGIFPILIYKNIKYQKKEQI